MIGQDDAQSFALKGNMMQQSRLLAAGLLAALLVSTAAGAQVTPEQVWQNWKDLGASYGQTLTATSETREGDTLVVTGLVITQEDEELSTRATVDRIGFRDRGDGTVEITLSPQVPVAFRATPPDEPPFTVDLRLDQPGLVIVASADASATRYDVSGPSIKATLDVPPSDDDPADVEATVELLALAGQYSVSTDELSRITSEATADGLRLTVNAVDPNAETGGTMVLNANVSGLAGKSTGAILSAEQMEDVSAALAAGYATDGTLSYAGGDFTADLTDTTGPTKVTGRFGPGNQSFGMNKDRLAVGGAGSDTEIRVSGATIPFPELVLSYAETAIDFFMPVSMSEVPQDFKLLARITDLAISDEVWAMFDPSAALPRDPATLVIDTVGQGRWLMDIFSPEAAATDTVPGELTALTINELLLRAVGASLTGQGALTFDNSDLTTFDGMPAPTGTLALTMVGANALLDRLSQSGLLPPDQVMGARMMMGLFGRPGEGPDTLTSSIEFKDKGLFVNGQQLQ
jgi:hypothetical protein